MSKTVAIHQPNFMPWVGYFYKIAKCDVFVVLDNVDFQQGNKNSITSRTKIKCGNEEKYLSLSVKNNKDSKLIKDIKIDKVITKMPKLLKTISYNYAKANSFNEVYPVIEQLFLKLDSFEYLSEANTFAINEICKLLGIETSMVTASQLNLSSDARNERIIEICKTLNGTIYFSGHGGKAYHDEFLFKSNSIDIAYTDFKIEKYTQSGTDFIPGLSIIDALLNVGVSGTRKLLQLEN